jgi:hypothetical protein
MEIASKQPHNRIKFFICLFLNSGLACAGMPEQGQPWK